MTKETQPKDVAAHKFPAVTCPSRQNVKPAIVQSYFYEL